MAYTKAPTTDTYSSERIKLYREMSSRDGSESGKDEDYINVFIETVRKSKINDDRKFIVKRAGTTIVKSSVASSEIRGMFYWADQYKLYYCVGKDIIIYDANAGTSVTLSNVFTTTTGHVGFCEFLYSNGTVKIVVTDGTGTTAGVSGLNTIDSANTVVNCSDADLPAHLPYPIFLDGYLFIAKSNSADIYNSDTNDPLSWTAGTLIQAEMEADLIVRIAKLNNYLVVFGKETIEYFWDAGIAAPDSPLQRNDSPVKINTYLGGFAIFGNSIYYIGTNAGGQPDVFMLKDFKIEPIGSTTISRYLNIAQDGITNWQGSIISIQGHTFYLITAGNTKTFVFDVEEELWTRWAFQGGTTFDIVQTSVGANTTNVVTYFALHGSDSTVYKFDQTLYQDNGVNYTCTIITEGNDFGTMNRKSMKRLSILGDRPASDANILVQWSDDDYRTYSTGVSTNLNQDLPSVYRLGNFRQRIFKLTFTANQLFRIQELEVDINKGNA